jgi:cytochrome d ubiquinol oxidase subunit II
MFDYETLRIIWWLLLGVLLTGFAVTDGFDLGVGMLFRRLGRTDAERRALLETIEPVWDGNQVWFILGGGAIFAAWPPLYAASFSGFYIAMFVVLAALILRPVGFMFRNKLTDARWRNTWDWALFVGGFVPALIFGVAIGNVLLGVPFRLDSSLRLAFEGGFFRLLSPFGLLCGLTSVAMLAMHGGAYAALKTGEPMSSRAATWSRRAALAFIVLFSLGGVAVATWIDGFRITSVIDPNGFSNPLRKEATTGAGAWLANFTRVPLFMLAPLVAYAGAGIAFVSGPPRPGRAFSARALALAGTIFTTGFALYPFLLPSSLVPAASLTIWDASSSEKTLGIMLIATLIFLPIVLAYTAWVFRILRGKVTLEQLHKGAY